MEVMTPAFVRLATLCSHARNNAAVGDLFFLEVVVTLLALQIDD
jgi:hypothetical protein